MSEAADIVSGPNLLEQYGCGPIRFSGHQDALYERHLLFDDIIDPVAAAAREQFEAAARSVRDVLSQRGCRPSASTIGRTRNASIICRWNF
jgi:starch phosphorylase